MLWRYFVNVALYLDLGGIFRDNALLHITVGYRLLPNIYKFLSVEINTDLSK